MAITDDDTPGWRKRAGPEMPTEESRRPVTNAYLNPGQHIYTKNYAEGRTRVRVWRHERKISILVSRDADNAGQAFVGNLQQYAATDGEQRAMLRELAAILLAVAEEV